MRGGPTISDLFVEGRLLVETNSVYCVDSMDAVCTRWDDRQSFLMVFSGLFELTLLAVVVGGGALQALQC